MFKAWLRAIWMSKASQKVLRARLGQVTDAWLWERGRAERAERFLYQALEYLDDPMAQDIRESYARSLQRFSKGMK